MPLRARSGYFIHTNNCIDLNRINQVSRILPGDVCVSRRSGAAGRSSLCSGPRARTGGVVQGGRYFSWAPAWPHGCQLLAGTSTVNGKFTSEMFSWSQPKHECRHIPGWPRAQQYCVCVAMAYLGKAVGDQYSQFTTNWRVVPMTGLTQERVSSCIHLTCLKACTLRVFWGADWCRK